MHTMCEILPDENSTFHPHWNLVEKQGCILMNYFYGFVSLRFFQKPKGIKVRSTKDKWNFSHLLKQLCYCEKQAHW